MNCDPVGTLSITSKQVQNLSKFANKNKSSGIFYQYYKYEYYNDWRIGSVKLRLSENILKVYDFVGCFYLNVNEYLIEWLCGLKSDRNKQKIAGISNSVSKILYYTK